MLDNLPGKIYLDVLLNGDFEPRVGPGAPHDHVDESFEYTLKPPVQGKVLKSPYDDFEGTIIGAYTTREGKQGLVLQQVGTRVVHVYGLKWFEDQLDDAEIDRLFNN